jgi:hypothetical protein
MSWAKNAMIVSRSCVAQEFLEPEEKRPSRLLRFASYATGRFAEAVVPDTPALRRSWHC